MMWISLPRAAQEPTLLFGVWTKVLNPALSEPKPHLSLIPQQYWTPDGEEGSTGQHSINSVSLKQPECWQCTRESIWRKNFLWFPSLLGILYLISSFHEIFGRRLLYFEIQHPTKGSQNISSILFQIIPSLPHLRSNVKSWSINF